MTSRVVRLGPIHADRENMTSVWQMLMPPSVFSGAVQLIRKTIGDDWAELERRMPSLA